MIELRNYAVTEHLNGPTGPDSVKQRSGNLTRSLTSEVQKDDTGVTGLVGIPTTSTAQAYARILHEGGTTREHVIEAVNAKYLAFYGRMDAFQSFASMAGEYSGLTFRRRVNHPGSNFPARPYLKAAFDEQITTIRANLIEAMKEASA